VQFCTVQAFSLANFLGSKWVRVMLNLIKLDRNYSPETIAVMTAAFDRVCQSVSTRINGNDAAKQTLALIIIRHVDHGERDPIRLSDIALREWTGADRAATKEMG
jgi:hypothetical protein